MIRGDRRKEIRKTERRAVTRTPGKMKLIMDAVHEVERKMQAKQ